MYIEFRSSRLRKQCESFESAKRAWGQDNARRVMRRINALKAAQSIDDLSPLPPMRCHPLKGNRLGQYAMDLQHPFRLVFELLDEERVVSADSGAPPEKGVRILKVEDYHGKTRK